MVTVSAAQKDMLEGICTLISMHSNLNNLHVLMGTRNYSTIRNPSTLAGLNNLKASLIFCSKWNKRSTLLML